MKRLVSFLLACTMVLCCVSAALGEAESNLWNGDSLFTLGTVNGSTYENAIMGYGCVLDGWTFASAADIAEMNNWAQYLLSEDMQDLIASADNYMDMYAATEDGLSNVNVQFQNMSRLYGTLLTEELVVSFTLPQLAPMLEQAGYTDVKTERITIMLGEDAHVGISVTGKLYGLPIYQKQVCILCGDYMVMIAVTSLMDDLTDETLSHFYKL